MTKALYSLIVLLSALWHSSIAYAANEQYYPTLPAPAPLSAYTDANASSSSDILLSHTSPPAIATNAQLQNYGTTNATAPSPNQPSASLINQIVSQNLAEPSAAFAPAFGQMLNGTNNNSSGNETYDGLRQFWYLDVFNTFTNASAFFANFFNNLTNIHLPSLVGFLCSIVKSFFLNTDLTQITDTSATNDFSYMLTQLANTIYGIALDLSLLLFILSIWSYWTQAAWHGRGSAMSAVGRLIATMGILLAWTTIYKFEIKLSNEMLSALFPDSTGQIQFFDLVMATLLHQTSALPNTATLLAAVPATTEYIPAAGAAMQGIIALAPIITSVIVCFLAIILIYELLYLIVLKAIQTALLTAQYVFAPFFLVFFANPVTDNIATSYLRTFVEVSLWNFIWIGLLKILIILLYSNFNPWGKILTVIGVLQLMMNVPQFLSHAKISAASDFVSPHFFAKALKDISSYDQKLKAGTETMKNFFGGAPTRSHSKEESTSSLPPTDNFTFTGSSSNNMEPPPLKTNNSSAGQAPGSTNRPGSDKSKNAGSSLGSGGAFTAGNASGSSSATSSTMSTGIAFASATSTANAVSMAIATINNPPADKSTNSPNDPAPKPKPDPSGPGSSPPPAKPNVGSAVSPENNPSQTSNFSWQPNSGTKLNQQQPPISSQVSNLSNAESHTNNLEKNSASQNSTNESDRQNIDLNQNPCPRSNITAGKSHSSLTRHPSWNSFTSPIPPLFNSASTKDSLPELATSNDSLESSLTAQKQTIAHIPEIAPSNRQIALSQTHAFQSGALNYYSYKKNGGTPFANSIFYHPQRAYGTTNSFLDQYAYNLIFSHGNSPPLMGIPPIYPAPNRN